MPFSRSIEWWDEFGGTARDRVRLRRIPPVGHLSALLPAAGPVRSGGDPAAPGALVAGPVPGADQRRTVLAGTSGGAALEAADRDPGRGRPRGRAELGRLHLCGELR